ncbi:ATP-binding protein [Pedobacter gandavensis]|uniref:AAA family ATPase n=1 Tax=Pedobacter gandavensis TaxID=2679963 RepID=A0ABR6ERX5_9SPHI|nr:ATP-binding protein [Pedobacter gandavensis]MBB2147952.1 AAA family ATPase [Pedobacter gandavensis]
MDIVQRDRNAVVIEQEMKWLSKVIESRMQLHWAADGEAPDVLVVEPDDLNGDISQYAKLIKDLNMNTMQRICLLLALAPHFKPHILDVFFIKNTYNDRGFTEFGGIKGNNHGGFLPTGETAAFVIAGNDMEKRFELLSSFMQDAIFNELNILNIQRTAMNEPFLSGFLTIAEEYLIHFVTGVNHRPSYSTVFPAKLLGTALEWEHLVLEDSVMDEVLEICDWLQFKDKLMGDWEMAGKLKPGFRGLFYGPPGTGKTLTASLLGKKTKLDVYRIDLSMVVSKFIGETEKNLSNIFDQAMNKNWILFFDEADALFGKRTQTSSSNDRHANQEVSYLLQRIEEFPGMVILATNFETNIDEAFSRRFQAMIHFPLPGPDERFKLWQQSFSAKAVLEDKINLRDISEKYELSGGSLINIVRYCSLRALKRDSNVILLDDMINGLRREFNKDGKTINI